MPTLTRTAPTGPAGPDRSAREPFAALPHSIAGRPDITPTEKAVLLALLFWARAKAVCWPSDRSIGGRIGRSVGTVQRALRRLEGLGLVERQKVTTNATGRELVLRWRLTPAAPALDPRQPLARDEGEKEEKSKTPRSGREATGAETGGKEPTRDELVAWATGSDPILAKIGRAALAEAGELDPAGATTIGIPAAGTTPKLPAAVHDSAHRAAVPAAGNAAGPAAPTVERAAGDQQQGPERGPDGDRSGRRIAAPTRPLAATALRPDGDPILPSRRAWRGPGGRAPWLAVLAEQLRMPGTS